MKSQVSVKTTVLRDGNARQIAATDVGLGDLVVLAAGSLVPADGLVLQARDCFVNQAVLTGETSPVAKAPGTVPADSGFTDRNNCLFLGTNARGGVIVRRLASIEDSGSMDVLCTDKTGTLTVGVVQLDAALDPAGHASDEVFRYAYLNASLQTGLRNPLDEAITAHQRLEMGDVEKMDEIPYDFSRKRMSVVDRAGAQRLLISK